VIKKQNQYLLFTKSIKRSHFSLKRGLRAAFSAVEMDANSRELRHNFLRSARSSSQARKA
jgi:hypothetical protein